MNVFEDFFLGMNEEEWEFFATDFLSWLGFSILRSPSRGQDGGRDGLVEKSKIYLVSCKHFVHSGKSVGVSDEQSILDRISQHQAQGFLGFYSTLISTALYERFEKLSMGGFECIYYDKNSISNHIRSLPSRILEKYGSPKNIKYVMHVSKNSYIPLECLCCGKDILSDDLINNSMVCVSFDNNENLHYLYGCKDCLRSIPERGWAELSQVLHFDQFNKWVFHVNEMVEGRWTNGDRPALAPDFYKNKSNFESLIQQRTFPANWGRWIS